MNFYDRDVFHVLARRGCGVRTCTTKLSVKAIGRRLRGKCLDQLVDFEKLLGSRRCEPAKRPVGTLKDA